MMKKNLHRTALLLSIGLPYGMHAGEIPDKPNILIFIADDLGWEEVGAYGHPVVRTPNIDSLALNGLRFDNFFLTASSSSPSRASIFTGMYPSSTRAQNLHDKLPSEATLFTDCLQKNGYYTMLVGKNHGTNSPEIEKRFDYLKSVGKPWKMGDLWVEALRQRPKDKPFFMFAASLDPHRPYKQGSQGHLTRSSSRMSRKRPKASICSCLVCDINIFCIKIVIRLLLIIHSEIPKWNNIPVSGFYIIFYNVSFFGSGYLLLSFVFSAYFKCSFSYLEI